MIKYFLWISILRITSSIANDYCALCKNHTMCEFKGRSPTCGDHVESGITASEVEEIVYLHNLYRSKIANGSVICGSPGPQPPAANMNALTWDENLAKVAQRWADQCNFDHDKCRHDARFEVGQNMYVNIGPETVDWRRVIRSWYSGVLKFNKSTVDNFKPNIITNSYTQLVWANTRYIGCGRTIFETTSNDQENSLKYNKYISSTINGLKNKANNKPSNTDGAKITRQKRDSVEYFGEASMNEAAARGALGTFKPIYEPQISQMVQEPFIRNIQNRGYYPGDQYGAEEFNNNERTRSVMPWNSARQSERMIVRPQSTFYQQSSPMSNVQYYYTNGQQQLPVQQTYVSRYPTQPRRENFYLDNMDDYSSSYNDRSGVWRSGETDRTPEYELKGVISDELLKELNTEFADGEYDVKRVTDDDDSHSQFETRSRYIPGVGFVHYYGEKSSRVARSVNLEKASGNDDGDDNVYESKKVSGKKSSHQSAVQQATPTRKQILVCNYGPTGNVIDQSIYIKGKLCSECPPNTTCKNGLCSYN